MEFKFQDLRELKVADRGNGEISGYRAVFGVIDESGDIIVKGAFKDTLDQFLKSGWTAHSHDWSFVSAIGYPVEAYEDDHGWFVRSEFHSTPEAQTARQIAKERLKAGKQVGFSFGYSPTDTHTIEPRAYETELPRYLKPSYLTEGLRKAQGFARIRILKVLEALEDSLVTAPMNRMAAATALKGLHTRRSTGDLSMLRLESMRVRNHALKTLYGPSLKSELEIESERLNREAERTMLKLRVLESRMRAQRHRM